MRHEALAEAARSHTVSPSTHLSYVHDKDTLARTGDLSCATTRLVHCFQISSIISLRPTFQRLRQHYMRLGWPIGVKNVNKIYFVEIAMKLQP
ncbi:hypothetical protein L6452_38951 [Arctium lappa]|uniref:Uncharacterized protein n=1 Tax=Arctium lappa TaxID=4217 RepID=A0ACB8XRK6_ARCLA|nr:hypothetical protein L6452_38951 [Arctium lappa]